MVVKESEKILEDIHKLEKDIHFYKTELLLERPAEYIVEVRKLIVRAEEKKRILGFRLSEAKHREDAAEKSKVKK
jgi:hypothetical protein